MALDTNQSAVLLMLGASALVAGTSIIAKTLGLSSADFEGLHALQVSAGRYGFGFLTVFLFLLLRPSVRPNFSNANWPVHFVRALVGWLGVSAMFAAVAKMPVADATAISFLNPLVAMVLAILFLGESLRMRKIVAAVVSLVGAVLVLRPGGDSFQLAGLYALFAALCMGIEIVVVKQLTNKEPALQILSINNFFGACIALSVASFVWQMPAGIQWMLMMLLGAMMVSGQSLFIQALKRGEASAVSLVFYAVLIFAPLYDFIFYGVVPSVLTVFGTLFIAMGAMILARKVAS